VCSWVYVVWTVDGGSRGTGSGACAHMCLSWCMQAHQSVQPPALHARTYAQTQVCNSPDDLEDGLRDAVEKLGQADKGAVDLVSAVRGSSARGGVVHTETLQGLEWYGLGMLRGCWVCWIYFWRGLGKWPLYFLVSHWGAWREKHVVSKWSRRSEAAMCAPLGVVSHAHGASHSSLHKGLP